MRLLALALPALFLAGCSCGGPTAEPRLIVKSPIWFDSTPVAVPQNYAFAAPQQTIMVPVPQVQQAPNYIYAPAAMPRAVGPCGGEVPSSPPPVPGDDVPESIPALRK